jgi:uncharacterized protein DUF6922
MTKARPHALPRRLRPLFWDYRFATLTWEDDRELVISRVLSAGGLDAIRWLRQRAGDEGIREFLEHRHGAGLSPRKLRFWELLLKLPKRQVDAWLRDPSRQIWDQRVRR